MLTPLAFDEYCRFDTSALFYHIKRASLYALKESRSIKTRGRVNCQTHASAPRARAMHGKNLRKFTETRARPPRANYALISFEIDFLKMFSSVRKRGGADAFVNDPSFINKGTVNKYSSTGVRPYSCTY
jgi:hypothetical protein